MPARRLVTVSAAALLAAGLVVGPISAAQADTPGCVTKPEYKQVKKGMKMTKVHGIFDTSGKQLSKAQSGGFVSEVRSYKVCKSSYSSVAIAFDKSPGGVLKLSAKSAVWVS